MTLEWVVLSYVATTEAMMVLLLTLPPAMNPLRKGVISVTRNLLKSFLSVIPFCLFLLMDICWKYETHPSCPSPEWCNPTDLMRHQKSVLKSQRNALLIASALVFCWLLFTVPHLVTQAKMLNERVEKLMNTD